jgi:DNA-binding NarL/FixJ family response regulator
MSKRILLVGHCGIDGPRLKDELSRAMPGTEVERINSDDDLRRAVGEGADLLLVNREPVGFEGEGLDLIKEVKSLNPDCKVMLVSDHDDAQQDAERAGAMKGFGKSEMGSPRLVNHVKQALD